MVTGISTMMPHVPALASTEPDQPNPVEYLQEGSGHGDAEEICQVSFDLGIGQTRPWGGGTVGNNGECEQ